MDYFKSAVVAAVAVVVYVEYCKRRWAASLKDWQQRYHNVMAADDHIGEIEQSIRMIKEHMRTTIHGLPYRRLLKLMVEGLVYAETKNLNQFPAPNGVSESISPKGIVTGCARPNFKYVFPFTHQNTFSFGDVELTVRYTMVNYPETVVVCCQRLSLYQQFTVLSHLHHCVGRSG